MKTALLAIARYESDIYQWLDYNLYKLQFEHIYIIDNNPSDTPLLVYNDRVTVLHNSTNLVFNGICQPSLYNQYIDYICDDGYEWLAICDIDEYFDFKGKTINEYISLYKDMYTAIEIPWVTYSDNNHITIPPISPIIAYRQETERKRGNWNSDEFSWGKPIFLLEKGIKVTTHWSKDFNYSNGRQTNRLHESTKNAIVRHYRTKSLENYFQKIAYRKFRESPCVHNYQNNIVKTYFEYNKITLDKLNKFELFATLYDILLSPEEVKTLDSYKQLI